MSTLTMSTPVRQPFGSVSEVRLRNMTNLKNKQNALPSTPSSSVKRHAPADFDNLDTENIDPVHFFSESTKKAKKFDFNSSKLAAAAPTLFTLNQTPANTPAKRSYITQAAVQKRKAEDTASNAHVKRHEPSSAPAPTAAGRSPKHKRIGILSKRRHTANPFTRVDPPHFSVHKTGQPFSLAAALHGTVPTSKAKPKSSRKGWHFEIHEDTQDDEMANLMEHSTHTLDISDDEGRNSPSKGDRCNKENIAPAGYHASTNSSSRRDMMTEDVRSPLGDLEAKEFYADGCDASSIVIVPAEDDEPTEKCLVEANTATEIQHGQEALPALIDDKTALLTSNLDEIAPEIQIWESESAQDEAEAIENANAAAGKRAVLA